MKALLRENNKSPNTKGLIFNIQKFSINDGPGIRTVIFFKGCPLRCAWCANPESQRACPETMRQAPPIEQTTVGEYKTIPEIMHVVLQDRDFYEESGGGITFSGGEVLNQASFAIELARAIKQEGLSLACETTGYAKPEIFKQFISMIDFIFFDVKHWKSDQHRKGTGIGNELILQNLQTVLDTGIELLVRIPVIPQFNDSLEDARQFARLFQKIGVKKVELLPFHQFGLKKYEQLGRDYAMKNVAQLHAEDLQGYKRTLEESGLMVKLN